MKNFFMIIGAAKCGTTSLANWLDQHPDIKVSNPKEPLFFECEYPLGEKFYMEKYWNNIFHEFNGEARARNLIIPYVPQRVADMFGNDVKIIVCVREPVRRMVSEWAHWRAMRPGREPLMIHDAIQYNMNRLNLEFFADEENVCSHRDIMGGQYHRMYIEAGHYSHYIKKWKEHFQNILVVPLEEMIKEKADVYKAILHFLGVKDNAFVPDFSHLKRMPSFVYEDAMTFYEDYGKALQEYWYKDSIKELCDIAGYDFENLWRIE